MARNRKAVLKAKKRVDEKRALLEKEAQAKAAQKVPSANESASKEPQVSSSSIDVTDTPPKKDAGDTASVSSAASNKEAGRRKRKAKTDRKPRRERFDPKPFQNAEVEPAENILVFLMYITPYLQMQMGEHAFRVFPGLVYVSTTLKQYQIAEATETDPRTVRAGTDDFMSGNIPSGPKSRQRRSGGGRKKAMEKYRHLCDYIRHLIDAVCYGSCTAKGAVVNHVSLSCEKIRSYLKTHYNIRIGVSTVYLTLRLMNITPKANRKLKNANKTHITPVMQMRHDRQFLKISKALKMARRRKTKKYPILSLDCKKKENLGDYAYSGKAWTYKGEPILVYDHDFIVTLDIESLDGMEDLLTRAEGKAVPYGIYDILRNEGYVNIGISHDTPAFAVASLEAFLPEILKHYPNADKVVLMLDGGGSNGAHSHVFKHEIEKLSRRIGLKFEMYHYPPGKSKYNKIEHRMFSEISKSFRGLPLKNLKVMMARVRGTRTRTGLQIMCRLDVHEYRTGERVTKEEEAALNIWYDPHDDEIEKHWHYIIDGTAREAGAEPVKRRTVFEVREELLRERKEKAEAKEAEKKARAEAKKAEKEAQARNIAAA